MDKVSSKKQKKIETVSQFEEKIKRAKALVLADYRGLTHRQLEELKKAVKAAEAEFVVTKNTLLKRALTSNLQPLTSNLTGPTATLFAYGDIIIPLRELAKSIKTLKLPVIKLGFWEGRILTGEDVLKLALLPSREVLIAQLVGRMQAPMYGLHRTLSWNIQRLVITLKAIEGKKS